MIECFDLDPGSEAKLDSYRSQVYRCTQSGEACILKIFHWRHRSADEIEAELWWLFFLQGRGLSVSLPLPSPNGRLIETFDTEWGPFFAVLYEIIPGPQFRWADMTEEVAETWGELAGTLHCLSMTHCKSLPSRRNWLQESNYNLEVFGADFDLERDAARSLIKDVLQLPRNPRTFGLIHADLHPGNIRLQDGRFILFDADSSVYHWYLYDFAVMLNEIACFEDGLATRQMFAEFFLQAAFRGYRRAGIPLSSDWKDPSKCLELLLELEHLGDIILGLEKGRLGQEASDPSERFNRMLQSLRTRTPPLSVPRSLWISR